MCRKIFLVFIVVLTFIVTVYGEDLSEYEYINYSFEIESDNSKNYSMFSIPDEVYEYSENVKSIYLIDEGTKEEIPYFIINEYIGENEVKESYNTTLIVKDKENIYDSYIFRVYENDNKNLNYNKIYFETNKESFSEVVNIYGSYDNINFEAIKMQNIYVVNSDESNVVYFNVPVDYKFLKVNINSGTDTIIENILVYSDIVFKNNEFYKKEVELDFKIEELKDENTTKITLDTRKLKKRDVFTLRFDIEEENFSREIALNSINNTIMDKLERDEQSISEINLNNNFFGDEYYIFIKNKSNKPLTINSITSLVLDEYIIFNNENYEKVTLNFDSNNFNTREYDLESTVKDEDLLENTALVKAKNFKVNKLNKEAVAKEVDVELFLNITLVAVAMITILLGVKSLKRKI